MRHFCPRELEDKFAEMAPILKNVPVSRDELLEHMREFAEEHFLKTPQRMLIGSLRAEKILLLSEFARWYLRHGLVITRVYQLIVYTPREAFRDFGGSVSKACRAGDANPGLALLASTSKLVGKFSYGKTITNKDKHLTSNTSLEIGRPLNIYDELTSLAWRSCWTSSTRSSTNVGYFDRRAFQYVEMDTDSAYMALTRPLESRVRPELRAEFYEHYSDWFPRPYCSVHKAKFVLTKTETPACTWTLKACCEEIRRCDMRTPGLFKEEFEGSGIVTLNLKTYFCLNEDETSCKYSSKGLSKRTNAE